jgi:hypothetical protein
MSWKSRRRRSYNRAYQPKFFFSEQEIDFTTETLDYGQFLLQEFFLANTETRKKISNYYIKEYGSRSYAYLARKYSEWANGNYHLTDMMRFRIISIMPTFITDNAKYKLGIHEFMASIKNTVKSFQNNQKPYYRRTNLKDPNEIVDFFEKEYDKIQELVISNFRFNVLSEEEKTEALEISKYILEIKLQQAFDQIERDFNVFLPFMYKFKRGVFTANYSITRYSINIDIANTGLNDVSIPNFKINEYEANSRFKEYSDKYLAYELVSMHKEANKAISDSFLNANDIELFFNHYEELSNGESAVNMNSTFQGEGGTLRLKAEMKPLKLLKTSIIVSSTKLVIYCLVITIFVSLIINNIFLPFLYYVGFFLSIMSINIINEEIKKIKSLTKEYKTYGK